MTDVHNRAIRSYNMSQIKNKNTKPELIVRKFLHSNGFRYRLHNKKLLGKPDIVLKKYNTVIFINGCFWHGHEGCKYFVIPKTRTQWWLDKINRNKEKDTKNIKVLLQKKWKVFVVWECELKTNTREQTLKYLICQIGKNKN